MDGRVQRQPFPTKRSKRTPRRSFRQVEFRQPEEARPWVWLGERPAQRRHTVQQQSNISTLFPPRRKLKERNRQPDQVLPNRPWSFPEEGNLHQLCRTRQQQQRSLPNRSFDTLWIVHRHRLHHRYRWTEPLPTQEKPHNPDPNRPCAEDSLRFDPKSEDCRRLGDCDKPTS